MVAVISHLSTSHRIIHAGSPSRTFPARTYRVQIGILLLVYGLVHLWMNANSKALSGMDRRQYYGSVTVTRISPYQLTDTNKRPIFQLPNSEVKGILSDTFEMDYIDAEFIPVDEAVKDSKKE